VATHIGFNESCYLSIMTDSLSRVTAMNQSPKRPSRTEMIKCVPETSPQPGAENKLPDDTNSKDTLLSHWSLQRPLRKSWPICAWSD
jgi:hypothetical protein